MKISLWNLIVSPYSPVTPNKEFANKDNDAEAQTANEGEMQRRHKLSQKVGGVEQELGKGENNKESSSRG